MQLPNTEPTLTQVRHQFPIVDTDIYFDSAGVSPLSIAAERAASAVLNSRMKQGKLGIKSHATQVVEGCRTQLAKLLSVSSDNIALTANTTQGLNQIALGLKWRPGDEILLPDNEFPANQYPWLALQRRGVKIIRFPVDNGKFSPQQLRPLFTSRTRLLAISHVGYATGFTADLAGFGELCHRHQAAFIVDAAQSLGAVPIDPKLYGISALAAPAWKWLLGLVGHGLLYCESNFIEQLAPSSVGVASVALSERETPQWPCAWARGARRFECSSLETATKPILHTKVPAHSSTEPIVVIPTLKARPIGNLSGWWQWYRQLPSCQTD